MIGKESVQRDILKALINDYRACGNQTLSITSSVKSLTIPENARYAFIQVESTNTSDALRYWVDGSYPTASTGIVRGNLDCFDIVEAQNLVGFKVIAGTGGGTTHINVQYYK